MAMHSGRITGYSDISVLGGDIDEWPNTPKEVDRLRYCSCPAWRKLFWRRIEYHRQINPIPRASTMLAATVVTKPSPVTEPGSMNM